MNGDFSRVTRRQAGARSYDRVELQQGRVLLDADWNEQSALDSDRARRTAHDVVGDSGVPRRDPGFLLRDDGATLVIGAGRAYVEGVEIEQRAAVAADAQPFGGFDPTAMPGNGPWLAYLEVWERFVGADEDANLLEPALGGPDTATRVQKAWRVAVVPITAADRASLETGGRPDLAVWRPTDGTLEARDAPPGAAPAERPCLLPAEGGYAGPENRLYRVEVHRGGTAATARFKVSSENGSVRATLREVGGVRRLVGEREGSFANGQWVELRSPGQLLRSEPGTLHVLSFDGERNVTFQPAPAGAVDEFNVLRWDHRGGDTNGVSLDGGWVDLADGIQVRIEGGSFAPGDYWCVPARASLGRIEWPPVLDLDGTAPLAVRPEGPWRAFAPLHVLDPGPQRPTVGPPLIVEFPPLTGLEARDVSYDSTRVDIGGAETVQEALENLAGRDAIGNCTLHAGPGDDLQAVIDSLPAGADARLCLAVGDYLLPATLTIADKGHLQVTGAGSGTRLSVRTTEPALRFTRCQSVEIRDLHAIGQPIDDHHSGRNGVVHVTNCGRTTIESISITRGGASGPRAATGVTVEAIPEPGASLGPRDVTIRDCRLRVGLQQIGIQVINARRARIAGNVIHPADDRSTWVWDRLVRSRELRGAIADLLINNRRARGVQPTDFGADLRTIGWHDVTVNLDGNEVDLIAFGDLGGRISSMLRSVGPPGIEDTPSLAGHVRNQVMRALANGGRVRVRNRAGSDIDFDLLVGLVNRYRRRVRSHVAEGIVVAGRAVADVEVRDNEVNDALVGIRIALSHAGQTALDRDIVERCVVEGNRVRLLSTPLVDRPIGIDVANPDSMLVRGNLVTHDSLNAPWKSPPIGVSIRGRFGPFVEVESNDVRLSGGRSVGVLVTPDPVSVNRFSAPAWLVSHNNVRGAASPYSLGSKVDNHRNFTT